VSAEAGVLFGAHIQENIRKSFGDAGSDLYVSAAFVLVLGIVGTFILLDAIKAHRAGEEHYEEKMTKLARWIQSVNIPGTMVYFRSLNARVSFLFTIPLGFATGMLAATIAVGGFIGVPAMIYVLGVPSLISSATELVIAFVMGMGGSFKYALSGLVDIRLSMILLAGSLFGVQLGAIGTTYVKGNIIKIVMGLIMVIVLFSRALMIPVYMSQLGVIRTLDETTRKILSNASFSTMAFALLLGAFIIFRAIFKGIRAEKKIKIEGALEHGEV
jgi:uncharacterized membrane protein YfcA